MCIMHHVIASLFAFCLGSNYKNYGVLVSKINIEFHLPMLFKPISKTQIKFGIFLSQKHVKHVGCVFTKHLEVV